MSDKTLPPSWRWVPLAELAAREPNAITDGPFGSKLKTAHYTESGPRVVRLQNVGEGQFLDERAHISESHFNSLQKHRVYPGDLVIAALGETLPRACMIPPSLGPAIVKADCIRFKPDAETVSAKFLLYSLLSPQLREQAGWIIHGVGRPRLNQSEIKSLRVPLAQPVEQERIVAEIEKEFTRLDAGIAAIRRLQAHLKRYRAAVLQAACEGRLVPTESALARKEGRAFKPAEVALRRALDTERPLPRRELQPTPKLRPLPAGWSWARAAEFAEVQGGIQKQPSRAPRTNAYPFLRVANVLRGRLDLREIHQIELFGDELERLRLQRGDLLIIEGNGSASEIGRMAVWDGSIPDCVHQNHIIRLRPSSEVLPQYVAIYWNSPEGRAAVAAKASSTSGLFTLSVSKVGSLPVPIPPIAEQHRIVAEVEAKLSDIDALVAAATANLSRAANLRSSVLRSAFEGRLVPQNPGDDAKNLGALREAAVDSAEPAVPTTVPPKAKKAGAR